MEERAQYDSRIAVYENRSPVTPIGPSRAIAKLDEERLNALKRTYFKGLDDGELAVAVAVTERTGLSPEGRQIFFIKRWDAQAKREVMQPQISIDGFRLIAERTGNYLGQHGPWWCGPDGVWKDVWLEATPPAAAKVAVLHRTFRDPLVAVARFDAYAQKTKDGALTRMWKAMPDVMIAKCAESLALRRAFPQELSGLYTQDEMGQAMEVGGSVDGEPVTARQSIAPARDDRERLMRRVHAAGKDLGWTHDVLHSWAVSKGYQTLKGATDAELEALARSFEQQPDRARAAVAKYQPATIEAEAVEIATDVDPETGEIIPADFGESAMLDLLGDDDAQSVEFPRTPQTSLLTDDTQPAAGADRWTS